MNIAPRYALLIGMVLGALIFMLLGGCATTQRIVIYLTHDCAGNEVDIRVREITTPVPGPACVELSGQYDQSPVMTALQLPISCAYRRGKDAVVVLASWAWAAITDHEYGHLAGRGHPAFVPFHTEECRT